MPFYARRPEKEYSPAPQGLWPAVCVDVVDKGLVKTYYGEKYKLQLRFELEEIDPDSKKPFMVVQPFTNSMHEKAKLRQFLEAWRGKKFESDNEAYAFDFERLIGANCQLSITHNIVAGGDVYANIVAIVGPNRNMMKLMPSPDYIRAKDRKDKNGQRSQAQQPHTAPTQQGQYDPFAQDEAQEPEPNYEATDEDLPF